MFFRRRSTPERDHLEASLATADANLLETVAALGRANDHIDILNRMNADLNHKLETAYQYRGVLDRLILARDTRIALLKDMVVQRDGRGRFVARELVG